MFQHVFAKQCRTQPLLRMFSNILLLIPVNLLVAIDFIWVLPSPGVKINLWILSCSSVMPCCRETAWRPHASTIASLMSRSRRYQGFGTKGRSKWRHFFGLELAPESFGYVLLHYFFEANILKGNFIEWY